MIVGTVRPGASQLALEADSDFIAEGALATPERAVRLVAYMDGAGGVSSVQHVRAVIWGPGGEVLDVGEELTLDANLEPGWVAFPLGRPGLELPADTFRFGIQADGTGNVVRLYHDDVGLDRYSVADAYGDGPDPLAAPHPGPQAGPWSMFLEVISGYVPSPDVGDLYISRLPFELTQRIFGATGPEINSRQVVRAGWHSVGLDPEEGAVAIARKDGPLEELVGERLRIGYRPTGSYERVVFVYLNDVVEWPEDITDEDFSLTARAWLELAPWPLSSIEVSVEVLV